MHTFNIPAYLDSSAARLSPTFVSNPKDRFLHVTAHNVAIMQHEDIGYVYSKKSKICLWSVFQRSHCEGCL